MLQTVLEKIYKDYPTYRAVVLIVERLKAQPGIVISGRLSSGARREDDTSVIELELGSRPVRFLEIVVSDAICFRFRTLADLTGVAAVMEKNEPGASGPLRIDDVSGKPYEVCVRATEFDYSSFAVALVDVTQRSPLQRLLYQDEDTEVDRLLRDYFAAESSIEKGSIVAELDSCVRSGNPDINMEALPDYNPWHEEDPDSTLELKHSIESGILSRG